MKEIEIVTRMREYLPGELPGQYTALVDAAKEATRTAYAPYSHFHVGAAVELADGTTVTGSNQENAAYPSGLCAERTAVFSVSATHPGVALKRIAIAAWTMRERAEGLDHESYFQAQPISPCGACRQALLEYEHRYGPIEVVLYGRDRTLVFDSVAALLPYSFTDF